MIKAIFFDFFGVINVNGALNREVAEFLNINNDKYLFGILSAAEIDLHDWLITHGINDYFAVVKTTSGSGESKAQAEFYLDVLNKLSVKPQEAIFVDDSVQNVEFASDLGMKSLIYSESKNFAEQIKPFL